MRPKLGLIAGQGDLPRLILEACRAEPRPIFVVALEGQTSPELTENVDHAWVRLGAFGAGMDAFRAAGVKDVVLAGGLKRPSLLSIRPDARGARVWARLTKGVLGDDGLLSILIEEIESEGFQVVGADDLLNELLAPEGPFGALGPDQVAVSDIERGLAVARAIGALDVGQAVIVQQGIVLGVESVEGTDAMVRRAGELRREGPGGVLVKIKKPGQERRVDLPTIGAETVAAVAAAGIRGIAVEAGETLVIGLKEVSAAADKAGIFVTGIGAGS